jgi:hypothetical protein
MAIDEHSRIEGKRLTIQEVLPTMAQLICSLSARAVKSDRKYPASSLKHEVVRWEVAANILRLTRPGILRFLVEELGEFSQLSPDKLEAGLLSLLSYALPSSDKGLASVLKVKLLGKDLSTNQAETSAVIFDTLMEISFESLKKTFTYILFPDAYKKLYKAMQLSKVMKLQAEESKTEVSTERDDFFEELFNKNLRVKMIENLFEKCSGDKAEDTNKKRSRVNKFGEKKQETVFMSQEEIEDEKIKAEYIERRRIEMMALNANRIMQNSAEAMLKRNERRQTSASSAFPNSKIIPVSAMKNILNSKPDQTQSKYIKQLKERVHLRGEQISFFEFAKEAALTQIDLRSRKGDNRKLNRLKKKIEKSGQVRSRSESPSREEVEADDDKPIALTKRKGVKVRKFKLMITDPEKKAPVVEPGFYTRACTCCVLF